VRFATEGLERVMPPGVTLVIVPGEKAFPLYPCGELIGMRVIPRIPAARKKKKGRKKKR
jgi:hypothetical protein